MNQTDLEIPSQVLDVLLSAARAKAVIVMRLEDHAIFTRAGTIGMDDFSVLTSLLIREAASSSVQSQERCVELRLGEARCLAVVQPMKQGRFLLGVVFPTDTLIPTIRQETMRFIRIIDSFIEVNSKSDSTLHQSMDINEKILDNLLVDEGMQKDAILDVDSQIKKDEPSQMAGEWVHLSDMPEEDNNQVDLEGYAATEQRLAFADTSTDDHLPSLTPEDHTELQDRDFSHEDSVVKVPPGTWQALRDHSEPGDDLASIFQGELSLGEADGDPDDWTILPGVVISEKVPGQVLQKETDENSESAEDDRLPTELNVSDITFSLMPFSPDQYLFGDLSKRLRQWLPEICRKYGWELIALSVRPRYVTWTLADFPEVLILEMLKIIRRETSKQIFEVFPGLRSVDRPEDYWAPGYLINQ